MTPLLKVPGFQPELQLAGHKAREEWLALHPGAPDAALAAEAQASAQRD